MSLVTGRRHGCLTAQTGLEREVTILLPPALYLVTRNSSGTEDSHHCATADRVGDSAGAVLCPEKRQRPPGLQQSPVMVCKVLCSLCVRVTGAGTVVVCRVHPPFREVPDVRAALGPGTPRRDTAS